jgi:hypothetical protein
MRRQGPCIGRICNALLREGGSGVREEARDVVEHVLAHAYELALLPPVQLRAFAVVPCTRDEQLSPLTINYCGVVGQSRAPHPRTQRSMFVDALSH